MAQRDNRAGWLLLAVFLAGVIGSAPSIASDTPLLAVAGPAVVGPFDEPVADPFPIRRVRATEAQLPELLKQLEAGPVVRLPRSEFERRVRTAGRATAEARILPRITATRFKAALVGGDLVGTAELDIVNTTNAPRFLPLDPLRLALGPATWANEREAVVVTPNGGGAAVWVERPGPQTLRLAWSLAGIAELGERRFELRVPPAATAELALELPAGQIPTTTAGDVLVTGPFPLAGNPPRAEWRFRFGGRSRLDFAVRSSSHSGTIAAATLLARYDIAPGVMTCGFEYDLKPAKGTVGAWTFTIDSGLHITDVVVNDRAGWTIDPPTAPGGPRTLHVTLRQPGAGGKVLVAAVASVGDPARPATAPLPVVRPVGAILDQESLELRLAAGLTPATWHAGDYRLTDSRVLADQSRLLSLTGTLLPPGTDRIFRLMPVLSTAPGQAEFATTEEITWQFPADRATIRFKLGLRIRRGALFQFALRLPGGYGVRKVQSNPDDLIVHHATTGGVVTVEFARPLVAAQTAELVFELTGPLLTAAPLTLSFPQFVPLGAAERQGVLAIKPGPVWEIDCAPGAGALSTAWYDTAEPRIPAGVAAAYRYRGESADGTLSLRAARADFGADVTPLPPLPGTGGQTAIALSVRSGGLTVLLVLEAGGGMPRRSWRVAGNGNAVAAAVELPAETVAALIGPWLGRPVAGPATAPARFWLIRFAHPVTGRVTLVTTTTPAPGQPETAPTWWIPSATPDPTLPGPGIKAVPPAASAWAFGGLYLVTAVRTPDHAVVVFGGMVDSSVGTSLPLRLPRGAEVRAASIGGRWLEPGQCRLSDDGVLRLPLPANRPSRFEVRYRLPVDETGFVGRVRSPEPGLPAQGSAIERWWTFASDLLPGWPVFAGDRGRAADLPALLGDSLEANGSGFLIARTATDEIRIGTARLADGVGFALAAGLFALTWAGWRRRHPFCAVLAVVLVLAFGVLNLLGPPWWQRVTLVPLVVGLIAIAAMVAVRGWRAGGVAVLALVLFLEPDTQAQAPGPVTVILLPADSAGREMVLAPRSVLDRLEAAPQPPGVVIASSSYVVRADETGARVTAKFVVHALSEGEATLPLADARLEKATVDRTAAYPTAPRPGVYSVPLPGKGRHEIEVAFVVPLAGTGTERELHFGVPECPATHLSADLPGAARQAVVVGRIGQRTSTEKERVKLEADVGAVKSLNLRWREGTAGTASIKVREGCIWDLTETGAELTACYIVRIEQGTAGSLAFDVPSELEPLAVTARALDPNDSTAVRDWTLGKERNGYRPLRIDFQAPAAGRILVVLTAEPRRALTRQPRLRFPKPLVSGQAAEPDAAYGLRTSGVAIEEPGRSGVIDFAPDALVPDFGRVTELWRAPGAPLRVFRPTPGAIPELRPTLRLAAEEPAGVVETTWRVGPKRADGSGVVRWSGKDALALVEFALPGARVLEIHGADVASWTQNGGRVQVWLRRPVKEGASEWLATATVPAAFFDAAAPRPSDMRLIGDTIRLRAAEGYAIHVERDRGWSALDQPGDGPAYSSTSPTALPVRVRLVPAPQPQPPQPSASMESPAQTASRIDTLGPRAGPAPPEPPAHPPAAAAIQGPGWVWVGPAVVGWVIAAGGLAVLVARWPRSTWPEQLGLAAGLLGTIILGWWWIGVAAWGLARLAWLIRFRPALTARPAATPS